jgi:uncharacterized membrane protein
MKDKHKAIILILITTIMMAFGQFFQKKGADIIGSLIEVLNVYTIVGSILYIGAVVVYISALKKGDLSTLFPFLALSFVWVALLSMFLLGEPMFFNKWMGVVLIVLGVASIGRGAK